MDEIYTDADGRAPNGKINIFDFQFLKIEFSPIFDSIQFFSIFKNCQ